MERRGDGGFRAWSTVLHNQYPDAAAEATVRVHASAGRTVKIPVHAIDFDVTMPL